MGRVIDEKRLDAVGEFPLRGNGVWCGMGEDDPVWEVEVGAGGGGWGSWWEL